MMSELQKLLIFVFGVATVALFQNCGQKFESDLASSSIPTELVVPDLAPTPELSKVLQCDTPLLRWDSLALTCLAKAAAKTALVGPLENFVEYEPKYPLYSDGASKRRWLYLPEGQKIDTQNPNKWIFPKGTIVFKQFSIDNQVVETRMIEKIDDGEGFASWRFSLFAARVDGKPAQRITTDILATPGAADEYVAGVVRDRYKIGNPTGCVQCHSGQGVRDVIQGLSYLQVSNSTTTSLKLSDLIAKNWLTHPPQTESQILGTSADREAIGYLQANCASCHHGGNGSSPGNFVYQVGTPLYDQPIMAFARARSSLADPNKFILPQEKEKSRIWIRFNNQEMPQIPLIQKDAAGQAILENWIQQFDPALLAPL